MRYLFLLLISFNLWALEVPKLNSPVMDTANMLSSSEKDQLEATIRDVHQQGIAQITILTIESLRGEVLEEYTIKVVENWKLGSKDKGNGILIFIAKQERKIRIEVGNGIEGEVTDFLSHRVIQNMGPFMRNQDYVGAFNFAIKNIVSAMRENEPKTQVQTVESPTNRLVQLDGDSVSNNEEQDQVSREQQLEVEKSYKKFEEGLSFVSTILLCLLSILLVYSSFNKKQMAQIAKQIVDEKKNIAEVIKRISESESNISKMSVDPDKHRFVMLEQEVINLRGKKSQLISDIQKMKHYLGVE